MEPIFPPFEPEPTPPQKRFRPVPLRLLFPNIVTLLALAAGLTSVRYAMEGRLELAVLLLVAAAVLDGLDGRIARLLKGTSRFGAELDSLADFFCFGCAPALMLYFWKLHDLKTAGWLAALLLAFAAALRLARFNVMLEGPERPAWQKAYSVGVPAPAGAMLAIFPITMSLAGLPDFPGFAGLILLWTLACAALMVSRLPSFSGKGLRTPISRQYVIAVLLLVVVILMLLVSHPFETLVLLTLVYLIGLPVAARRFRIESERESLAAAGCDSPVD